MSASRRAALGNCPTRVGRSQRTNWSIDVGRHRLDFHPGNAGMSGLDHRFRRDPDEQNEQHAQREHGLGQAAGAFRSRIAFRTRYMASMSNYYIFFLKDKFHLDDKNAQILLFVFLFAVAVGTFIGGPIGDRIGRKYVIWVSILGVAPFTLLLPYASLFWTGVLSVFIGLILASAFSAILVYAQELCPEKSGSSRAFSSASPLAWAGSAPPSSASLADKTSISHVFHLCAFLPLLGLLTGFLQRTKKTPGRLTGRSATKRPDRKHVTPCAERAHPHGPKTTRHAQSSSTRPTADYYNIQKRKGRP